MEELFAFAMVFGIVFLFYKWIELIVLKKERLNIVERLEGEFLIEYAKRLPIGIKSGGVSQGDDVGKKQINPVGKVLRWGLLLTGFGVGLVCQHLFVKVLGPGMEYEQAQMATWGWILLCGGSGLVISFIIEYFLYKKE